MLHQSRIVYNVFLSLFCHCKNQFHAGRFHRKPIAKISFHVIFFKFQFLPHYPSKYYFYNLQPIRHISMLDKVFKLTKISLTCQHCISFTKNMPEWIIRTKNKEAIFWVQKQNFSSNFWCNYAGTTEKSDIFFFKRSTVLWKTICFKFNLLDLTGAWFEKLNFSKFLSVSVVVI